MNWLYRRWEQACEVAAALGRRDGRKRVVVGQNALDREGGRHWEWRIILAGGSEHRAHQHFLDEQKRLRAVSAYFREQRRS